MRLRHSLVGRGKKLLRVEPPSRNRSELARISCQWSCCQLEHLGRKRAVQVDRRFVSVRLELRLAPCVSTIYDSCQPERRSLSLVRCRNRRQLRPAYMVHQLEMCVPIRPPARPSVCLFIPIHPSTHPTTQGLANSRAACVLSRCACFVGQCGRPL